MLLYYTQETSVCDLSTIYEQSEANGDEDSRKLNGAVNHLIVTGIDLKSHKIFLVRVPMMNRKSETKIELISNDHQLHAFYTTVDDAQNVVRFSRNSSCISLDGISSTNGKSEYFKFS